MPSFKRVKDCIIIIIIIDKNIEVLEANFEDAVKIYMDKTGYEASNTEIRTNCYVENEISMITGTRIALMVIEVWAMKLKQMEENAEFCFILCSDEEHVEVRFHKVRTDESEWLADDLESYEDGAVGYITI